jgi:hypothetical protein
MLTSPQKKIAFNVLKLAIVCFAVYSVSTTLYTFFTARNGLGFLSDILSGHSAGVVAVILLMPLNWFIESQKWSVIAGISEKISMKESVYGVLAGLATGAATPNRSGEFAGRIFALRETRLADGIALTVFSSLVQVIVTVIAGCAGIVIFRNHDLIRNHASDLFVTIIIVVVSAAIVLIVMKSGFIAKRISVVRSINRSIFIKSVLLSVLRYCVYGLQFYLLLRICDVQCGTLQLAAAIAVNYLVVTIIPTFMIMEVFVRGAVASGVIGVLCGNHETAAVCALLLWLLNVGIPTLAGVAVITRLRLNKSI